MTNTTDIDTIITRMREAATAVGQSLPRGGNRDDVRAYYQAHERFRGVADPEAVLLLIHERDRLRQALLQSGRAVGALLADGVSSDFLMRVPEEARLRVERLQRDLENVRSDVRDWVAEVERWKLEAITARDGAGEAALGLKLKVAQAYQMIGTLLDAAGLFQTAEAERVLDYFANEDQVDADFLPWPATPTPGHSSTSVAFDLRAFSAENRARCIAPNGFNHPVEDWSLSDWMVATLGEFGEAANVLKKLNRERDGIPGNQETPEALRSMFADEMADAFIYLDLLATAADIDLPGAVRSKFDRKSTEIGYCAPPPAGGDHDAG